MRWSVSIQATPLDYCRDRSFCQQDLTGANFQGADLRGCDFSGACLVGVDFTGARFGESRRQHWFRIGLILGLLLLGGGLGAIIIAFRVPLLGAIAFYGGFRAVTWIQRRYPDMADDIGTLAFAGVILILILMGVLMLFTLSDQPLNLMLVIAFLGIALYLVRRDRPAKKVRRAKPGTNFRNADLSGAIFRSESAEQRVEDVCLTGSILADVDFTHAWFGAIDCDYFYGDRDRLTRYPITGQFKPSEMIQAMHPL